VARGSTGFCLFCFGRGLVSLASCASYVRGCGNLLPPDTLAPPLAPASVLLALPTMSNRRQTLGVLSANRRHTSFEDGMRNPGKTTAMRSRQSMAPALASSASVENTGAIRRQTLAAPARPAFGAGPGTGRKSAGGDRKSIGGSGGGGGADERKSSGNRQSTSLAPNNKGSKYADPRPIKKKAYMEQEIREVIRFLCHHNYDHPITPKQLTQPTAKDFENIVLFLFTVVDRHYSFSGNIKHDIPLLYKGACNVC
jgi:hypothetical protein